jgi:hypothetical protein
VSPLDLLSDHLVLAAGLRARGSMEAAVSVGNIVMADGDALLLVKLTLP